MAPVRTLEEQYAYEFLRGFICGPGCARSPQDALSYDAYMAGVSYRSEHPASVDAIMSEFGFSHIEVEGIWREGDELSVFTPDDRPGEKWWFESFGKNIEWSPSQSSQPRSDSDQGVRLRINGYLSPEGWWGHLGGYSQEFLAKSATILGK